MLIYLFVCILSVLIQMKIRPVMTTSRYKTNQINALVTNSINSLCSAMQFIFVRDHLFLLVSLNTSKAIEASSKTPSISHSSTEGASEDTLQASCKTKKEADANNNCCSSSAGNCRNKGTSQSSPLWNRDDFKGPHKLDVRASKSQET